MTKNIRIGFALLLATLLGSASLLAQNPHVVGTPSFQISGNTITVKFNVAGLGNVSEATFSLEGELAIFSQCYNKPGNRPQADNKQETADIDQTATFPVKNGRTNATFEITPLGTLSCPGNQRAIVESASGTLDLVYQGQTLGSVVVNYQR